MRPKKIIIPSLFVVLMLTLFVLFRGNPARNARVFEAHQTKGVTP